MGCGTRSIPLREVGGPEGPPLPQTISFEAYNNDLSRGMQSAPLGPPKPMLQASEPLRGRLVHIAFACERHVAEERIAGDGEVSQPFCRIGEIAKRGRIHRRFSNRLKQDAL